MRVFSHAFTHLRRGQWFEHWSAAEKTLFAFLDGVLWCENMKVFREGYSSPWITRLLLARIARVGIPNSAHHKTPSSSWPQLRERSTGKPVAASMRTTAVHKDDAYQGRARVTRPPQVRKPNVDIQRPERGQTGPIYRGTTKGTGAIPFCTARGQSSFLVRQVRRQRISRAIDSIKTCQGSLTKVPCDRYLRAGRSHG